MTVDIISTDGETRVRDSMVRKSKQADAMFAELVQHMRDGTVLTASTDDKTKIEVPSWA